MVNALRRLLERLRAVWAVLTGIDPGPVRELPPPIVAPISLAALVAEAEAQGTADAATMMYDHWSFGVEEDEQSEDRDPEYVRSLRHRCTAAIHELHDRNQLTLSRLSHIYDRAHEWEDEADAARRRMTQVATWEAQRERPELSATVPPPPDGGPPGRAADAMWEGEARPLPMPVTLLIIGLLMAIEYPMQQLVLNYLLLGGPAAALITPVTVSASVLVVLLPYLAGYLFRGNRATGGERRLLPVIAATVVLWLYAAAMLGFLRGRVLEVEAVAGPGGASLRVTPRTVAIAFVTLLLVTGLMAFLLGLARRHPYQEAYARSRRRREWLRDTAQRRAAAINPTFRAPGDSGADDQLAAAERVIREACQAAEEAYFAALSRAVGDPTFTEAISRRRGRRATTPGVEAPQPDEAEAPA